MTSTEGQAQEQQQQHQPRPNTRFGPDLDGNEGMRVDVSAQLRDAGAGLRGDSGDPEYPRISNHYDGQEVIYKYNRNNIQNNCPQSIEAAVGKTVQEAMRMTVQNNKKMEMVKYKQSDLKYDINKKFLMINDPMQLTNIHTGVGQGPHTQIYHHNPVI